MRNKTSINKLDQNIEVRFSEIHENGQFKMLVKPPSIMKVGTKGKIKATIHPKTGQDLIRRYVDFEIIEGHPASPDRTGSEESNETTFIPPKTTVVFVDPDSKDKEQIEKWDTIKKVPCFVKLGEKELIRQVSFFIKSSDTNIIIVYVNEKHPSFKSTYNKYDSPFTKNLFRSFVEREIRHQAVFDFINPYYPKADEMTPSDSCYELLNNVRYRIFNNIFVDICYRCSLELNEQLNKKSSKCSEDSD